MTDDTVLRSFLERQHVAGAELAAHSDVLSLEPLLEPDMPPFRYVAHFACQGVIRGDTGDVEIRESRFTLGITFRPDHLRRVDPLRVVTWLAPSNVFHSNVRAPFVCVGHVYPGVELIDLLYGCYELVSYLNWSSDDALNEEAASWGGVTNICCPLSDARCDGGPTCGAAAQPGNKHDHKRSDNNATTGTHRRPAAAGRYGAANRWRAGSLAWAAAAGAAGGARWLATRAVSLAQRARKVLPGPRVPNGCWRAMPGCRTGSGTW